MLAVIDKRCVGRSAAGGNDLEPRGRQMVRSTAEDFKLSDPEKPPLEHGFTATEGRSARVDWGAGHSLAAKPGKVSQAVRQEEAHHDPEAYPTTDLEAAPIPPRGRPEGTSCKPQTIRRGARRGT